MCFVSNQTRLKLSKTFQLHNEHEDNRVRRFCTNWKKKYLSNKFNDYCFEHDIEWKSIVLKILQRNEIVKCLKQNIMLMINIMLKNVDLNDKWWIEFVKTINYLRNRFLMIDKSIIFYEIDTKKKFSFAHFRRIEIIEYVMKWNSIIKWKKLISKSFSIVLVNTKKITFIKYCVSTKLFIVFRLSSESRKSICAMSKSQSKHRQSDRSSN
jgi:hypothetical protein